MPPRRCRRCRSSWRQARCERLCFAPWVGARRGLPACLPASSPGWAPPAERPPRPAALNTPHPLYRFALGCQEFLVGWWDGLVLTAHPTHAAAKHRHFPLSCGHTCRVSPTHPGVVPHQHPQGLAPLVHNAPALACSSHTSTEQLHILASHLPWSRVCTQRVARRPAPPPPPPRG